MNVEKLAEALRLMGRAKGYSRTASLCWPRLGSVMHPMAHAHRRTAAHLTVEANELFEEAMSGADALEVYDSGSPRTPADYRRDGEAAARFLTIGRVLADGIAARVERDRQEEERQMVFAEAARLEALVTPRRHLSAVAS